MSQVAVLAKLTAKDGQRDALVAAINEALPKADDEPGTIVYAAHTDNGDANSVWFYELYADQDALKAHSGGEVIKALTPALAGVLGAPPQIIQLTPIGNKGIPS